MIAYLRKVSPVLVTSLSSMLLPVPAPAEPVRLPLDADSQARYVVRHPMHEFAGTARQLKGELRLPSPGQPEQGSLVVVVPVNAFDSGNRSRDLHLLEVLDAAHFPGVMFKSQTVRVESTRQEGGTTYLSGKVEGKLLFHGQTRAVSAPFSATMAPGCWQASTAFEIRLSEYGVARPALMMVPIEDTVRLQVELVTRPDPGAASGPAPAGGQTRTGRGASSTAPRS